MVSTGERAVEIFSSMADGVDELVVSGKSYSPEAAEAIRDFFLKREINKTLLSLNIADSIARRPEKEALASLQHLCDCFEEAPKLESIDISDNALGAKGVLVAKKLLSNKTEQLKRVSFRNNGLNYEAMKVVAEILLGDAKSSTLKVIHISNNLLESAGAIEAAYLVEKCPSLEEFEMTSTRVGREGSVAISKALGTCPSLRTINVSDNTFGEEGAEALADVLKECDSLEYAIMRDLSVEDDGMILILNALCESAPNLKVLDISTNELTEDSAEAIARVLKTKGSLEKVIVDENELGSDGAKTIADALDKELHKNLKEVSLEENAITADGAREIGKKCSNLPSLERLNLNSNSIARDAVDELAELLENILGDMEDNLSDDEDEDNDS